MNINELHAYVKVGDIIFTNIKAYPFQKVSQMTQCWTNHVGIVVSITDGVAWVAESCVPVSKTTSLEVFVKRSKGGRVGIRRMGIEWDNSTIIKLKDAVTSRKGILYDGGFNLYSKRQFCSRYVREVVEAATGVQIGVIENFRTLLEKNKKVGLLFWRVWYFGFIPWTRETVSPASLWEENKQQCIFDGYVNQ